MEILIGLGSGILGGAVLGAAKNYITNNIMSKTSYYSTRKKLKKSIKELNYNDFKDSIYEIKNIDVKYQTDYYIKTKQDFYFNDSIIRNKKLFIIKYDPNYDIEEERENSYSYSRRYSQFFT